MSERPKFLIFYFSGTGNTRIVANLLVDELMHLGYSASAVAIEEAIKKFPSADFDRADIVGIGYPIHSFNAPRIVFEFIQKLPRSAKAAFIFMTAASPSKLNHPGAYFTNKWLRRKGYKVFHQTLVVMPTNIFYEQTREDIDSVFHAAVRKISMIARELVSNKERRIVPHIMIRWIVSVISRIARSGFRVFGRNLTVSPSCNQCQICVRACPVGNIYLKSNSVAFRVRCLGCLRCIYNCPQKAIMPRFEKFAILKTGYNPDILMNDWSERNNKNH